MGSAPHAPSANGHATAKSGIGSAKGIRWKGELDGVDDDESGDKLPPPLLTWFDFTRSAPSWLVSMVLHLILLLILALLSSPLGTDFGSVLLSLGHDEGDPAGALTEFAILSDAEVVAEDEWVDDVPVTVDVPDLQAFSIESESPPLTPVDAGVGDAIIPVASMFGGRSGAMKKTLLAIYGGTPETESAVELGLKWLVRQQAADGSWSLRGPYRDGGVSENASAATAMALLAFMGAGHTHQSGDYIQQVEKGIRWLIKQMDRDGFVAKRAPSHQQSYAQAQASIAICELYAMTKDSWLRAHAEKVVDYAQKSQSPEGGWRYKPRFDSDTSVTGWFVMALQSARSAGIDVDSNVLYRVSKFLDTVESYDGAGYAYQPGRAPSNAMTAEGLLCRQYLGWPRSKQAMALGADALSTDYNFKVNDQNYYYWYYATQTLHHYGGRPWRRWNDIMRRELPAAQVRRGDEVGSWAPQQDQWGSSGGRLYTTCLAIYCLEVYYRHMPLYQATDEPESLEEDGET